MKDRAQKGKKGVHVRQCRCDAPTNYAKCLTIGPFTTHQISIPFVQPIQSCKKYIPAQLQMSLPCVKRSTISIFNTIFAVLSLGNILIVTATHDRI